MTTELDTAEALVRIRVPLERADGEPGPPDDWLWAEPLGASRYRVESCPFFAYGISRDDVVHALDGAGEEAPRLDDVVEKGGHRTLRLALDPGGRAVRSQRAGLPRATAGAGVHARGATPEARRGRRAARGGRRARRRGPAGARARRALVWEWADPRPC